MFKQQRFVEAIRKASLRKVVSITLLLTLISGLVISAHAWSQLGGKAGMPFLSRTAQSGSSMETVSVVLERYGFTPASITRAAGPFRLEVANHSGAQGITLKLRRDGGGSLIQEWKVQSGAQMWSETIDLAPGGYELAVVENPACIFHIAVQ